MVLWHCTYNEGHYEVYLMYLYKYKYNYTIKRYSIFSPGMGNPVSKLHKTHTTYNNIFYQLRSILIRIANSLHWINISHTLLKSWNISELIPLTYLYVCIHSDNNKGELHSRTSLIRSSG